jgi:hypothetical protein
MSFWHNEIAGAGWFQDVAWTLGAPAVLVSVVLGGSVLAQRYSRLVAGVPDAVRCFRQPWLTEHPRRKQGIIIALYVFGGMFHGRLVAAGLLCVALYVAAWAAWCIVSGRAQDAASRAYSIGLVAFALLMSLIAVLLYRLGVIAHP